MNEEVISPMEIVRLMREHHALLETAQLLARLPDHSPEMFDNPSVRVDIRRAIVEARAAIADAQRTE